MTAFVVLREGATAEAEEIIAFCRQRLAAYKVPRQVLFRDSLPRSSVGKYLRRELRKMRVTSAGGGTMAAKNSSSLVGKR